MFSESQKLKLVTEAEMLHFYQIAKKIVKSLHDKLQTPSFNEKPLSALFIYISKARCAQIKISSIECVSKTYFLRRVKTSKDKIRFH